MREDIQTALFAAVRLPEADQDRLVSQISEMLRDRGLPAPEPMRVIEF
ncbi:MAG: hypothetical protein AAFS03_06420 [Pseudomonadota bacterium]